MPFCVFFPSATYPRLEFIEAKSPQEAERILKELEEIEAVFKEPPGMIVAGEKSISVAEVVILKGEPGQWEEMARVPLA